MKTKIIGTFVLGVFLLAMQQTAFAGKWMIVSVDSQSGCYITDGDGDGETVEAVETGTEAFKAAVSEAIGEAASVSDICPDAHVSIQKQQ